MPTQKPIVRRATADDMKAVEKWLKAEYDKKRDGFYVNWKAICEMHGDKGVYVVVDDGECVAFLANGRRMHNIAEVRPDCRRRGYGRVIADTMVAQSKRWGLNVIEIDCAPETSVSFWSKMGFTPVPKRRGFGGGLYAYKEIQRREKAVRGRRIPYSIQFHDDKSFYNNGVAFRVCSGHGGLDDAGILQLPKRAVCFDPTSTELHDAYAIIEVDGSRLFEDKCKRDAGQEIGLQTDDAGIWYIDSIRMPN